MSSADLAVLMDGGGVEVYADGVDHCEIVGPVVKLVLFSIRMVGGQEERREAATVILPWEALPGGVAGLRQAFGDRVLPRRPVMAS